mmetsp:Transcript_97375/g.157021  ORF Transcript_97375/g.157021 Transcript_97375/m.157021 type:complete len:133 (+) Transcript_97375:1010-1408(+)
MQKSYMEVRKDLAQWLRQNEKFKIDMNAAELSEFQEDSSTCWSNFCDEVEDTAKSDRPRWGCHITLCAAAQCYKKTIRIWSSHPGLDWWLEVTPTNIQHNGLKIIKSANIEIAHQFEFHFFSVVSKARQDGK